MRTSILFLPLLMLCGLPAMAQINAGDIPDGYSVWDPSIDLQLAEAFTQDSAYIDVDCDGDPEIMVMLLRAAPEVDAPNSCYMHLLDTSMALCADEAEFLWRPQYHALSEPLECTGDYTWRTDSITGLGSYGGLLPLGPTAINNQFVAYRHSGQVGWIQLSFDMFPEPAATISLQIHLVLWPCLIGSVGSHDKDAGLTLFPNPGNGADIQLHATDALRSIAVLAHTGQVLVTYPGNRLSIPAPEAAGVYFVRAQHSDGQWSVSRFLRY